MPPFYNVAWDSTYGVKTWLNLCIEETKTKLCISLPHHHSMDLQVQTCAIRVFIRNQYSKWVFKTMSRFESYLLFWILIRIHTYFKVIFTYSCSKFDVFIVLILNNTHLVDFDSPSIDIYTKHKISIIRIRTLQYLLEGCVFFTFFHLFS